MKQAVFWAALAAALVLTGLLPLDAADASELLPAQVVLVWQQRGEVYVRCDADAEGRGATLAAAVWDMERKANGKLFLDTAEHIVISEGSPQLLLQAAESDKLRPAASVWLMHGEMPQAEEAAEFLKNRDGTAKLFRVRAARLGARLPPLPYLIRQDGRLVAVGA